MTYQAGCQSLQVPDPALDLAFPLYLLCPSLTASAPTRFGPYSLDVAVQGTQRLSERKA